MTLNPDSCFSYVIGYSKIAFNTFELSLGCGHKEIRTAYKNGSLPEKVICSTCYKNTHDKYGNKINENRNTM